LECGKLHAAQRLVSKAKRYIERFNGNFRRDVLDAYLFEDIQQVRIPAEEWMRITITIDQTTFSRRSQSDRHAGKSTSDYDDENNEIV
jgi:hypothetical protein